MLYNYIKSYYYLCHIPEALTKANEYEVLLGKINNISYANIALHIHI